MDVDYPELMTTKASVIREASPLRELVEPKDEPGLGFLVESEVYYGIGCDLRDLQGLDAFIKSLPGIKDASILFVAEVSVTYMDTDDADALIAWTRTLSDGM